ncbi:MAG: BTAD domain-containing putative transcriptional regulator [Hyphomicrobiaceae bacterium]
MPTHPRTLGDLPAFADRLRVGLIGGFSATIRGRSVSLSSRKAQALVAYLILAKAQSVSRQRLLSLLWSGSSEEHARGSLRLALHEIQKEFRAAGLPMLTVDRLTAGVDVSQVDVDLLEIAAEAKAGKVLPILLERDRLTDDLLSGLDSVDPVFAEWLRETRSAMHATLSETLEKLLPPENAETISADAEAAARALQRLSPEHERSARVLIKARAGANDLGTALQIYTELWKRLEESFDIEPSEETQNLVARIRMEQPAASVTPLMAANDPHRLAGFLTGVDARPSIAVLPYRSGSPEVASYFASGIVDNVVHVLSSFKELFVISRGSTQAMRDVGPDLAAVGRVLGVRYVLHGSVQRAGDRLRIMTELSDAEKGEVVRTLQHNGATAELFELQDQLAIDVVKAIAPYIHKRELTRAMRKRPQDVTAYDYVLQALERMYRLDYASYAHARALLQSAMDLDPTYAPAFAYAARWHSFRIGQEWTADFGADSAEAMRLSTRALALDEHDALALAVCGHQKSFLFKNYHEAIEIFDRALNSSPNLPLAWTYKAATLCFMGRGAEAIACAEFGLRLSPNDRSVFFAENVLGQAHYICGNYEEAVRWSERSDNRNKRLTANLRLLAASLSAVGRMEEAAVVAKRHMILCPQFRLGAWAKRTPLDETIAEDWVRQLRSLGVPE